MPHWLVYKAGEKERLWVEARGPQATPHPGRAKRALRGARAEATREREASCPLARVPDRRRVRTVWLPGGAGRPGQGSNNVVTVASFLSNLRHMGSGKLTQKGCRRVSVLRRGPSFCYGEKGENTRGCRKKNSTTVGCQVVWVKSQKKRSEWFP